MFVINQLQAIAGHYVAITYTGMHWYEYNEVSCKNKKLCIAGEKSDTSCNYVCNQTIKTFFFNSMHTSSYMMICQARYILYLILYLSYIIYTFNILRHIVYVTLFMTYICNIVMLHYVFKTYLSMLHNILLLHFIHTIIFLLPLSLYIILC